MTRTAAKCPLWFVSVIALLAASCRSQPALTEEAWDEAHKPVIPYHRTRPLFPPNWPDSTRQFPVEQPGEYDWRMHFNERLQEPVSFDFDATPLDDVVAFLRVMKKVSFDVDRRAVRDRGNLDVTMRVDNVPFNKALSQILQLHGLDYTLRDGGAVYVTTKDRLVARYNAPTVRYDPAEWKPLEPIMRRTISFDFRGEEAEEVFASLETRMGVPIILEEPSAKTMGVGLSVRDMQFRYALAWICCQLDRAYTIRDGKILISNPETLALTEEGWDKAHKMVIPYFRTRPLFPPNWPDTTREFPVEDQGTLYWRMINESVQEPVSVHFDAAPLDDVVAFLRQMRKLNLVIDMQAVHSRGDRLVTMRADNVPLNKVLSQILQPLELDYTLRDPALYITTRDELVAWYNTPTVRYDPAEWKPVEPIMRRTISFEFHGEQAEEVFASLEKRMGIPIILKEAPGSTRSVELRVRDMQFRYALAWICCQLDLAYTIRDGKVIVCWRSSLSGRNDPQSNRIR